MRTQEIPADECTATPEEQALLRSLGLINAVAGWWRPDDAPFYVAPPSTAIDTSKRGKWTVSDGGATFAFEGRLLSGHRPVYEVFDTFDEVRAAYIAHKLRGSS